MSLIVQKFGGSSVANAERVFNVAKIVTDTYKKGNNVVVVVSAQGDTTDDLIDKSGCIKKGKGYASCRRRADIHFAARNGDREVRVSSYFASGLAGRLPDDLCIHLGPHKEGKNGPYRQGTRQEKHRYSCRLPGYQQI